ncbi:MAG TPA: alpha-L-rhamnosidase N-terminal domain-containing protein, partial [Pseudomonadales bacterium]|nr:alpha-L-rhamnosidase N-terminal domain-containing protein [Pseudomonadales bacterium]
MKKSVHIILFAFTLALSAAAKLTPVDLRCDYATNPLGVDSNPPRLFWKLESPERGARQVAYEILVSSSPTLLAKNEGDLWDTSKVESPNTIQIGYMGKPLNSWQKVFWKVRVWDASGNISDWSRPADWIMGVLKDSDWHARWIGAEDTDIPSLLLRHEFSVKPGLKRALVNVCGLGQYELTIDGKKVGDDILSPGWTKYNKTCLYDTFVVTGLLRGGKNTVGLGLGNGMYQV